MVLWDGLDVGTSLAYDVPLAGPQDGNIPWSDMAGVLRRLAAAGAEAGAEAGAARSVDGLGIPVVDVRAETFRFVDEPSYDLGDALHAAVSMLGPHAGEPDPELLVSGFLLIDPDTVRLYLDRTAGPPERIGVDIALRDEEGRVRGGSRGPGPRCRPSYGPSSAGTPPRPRTRTARRCTTSRTGDARSAAPTPTPAPASRHMARSWPSQYGSRSRRLYSLPFGSRGIVSMKSTVLGRL